MNKIVSKIFLSLAVVSTLAISTNQVLAQGGIVGGGLEEGGFTEKCSNLEIKKDGKCVCAFGKFEALARILGSEDGDVCKWVQANTTAGSESSALFSFVGAVMPYILGIIILSGVIMIVVAGYIYMTAGSNTQRVGLAKSMLIAAVVGIVLALSSYLILFTINPVLVGLPASSPTP